MREVRKVEEYHSNGRGSRERKKKSLLLVERERERVENFVKLRQLDGGVDSKRRWNRNFYEFS